MSPFSLFLRFIHNSYRNKHLQGEKNAEKQLFFVKKLSFIWTVYYFLFKNKI